MIVRFDKSFLKSIGKITNKTLKNKIADLITQTENAGSLSDLTHVKKLTGFKNYYRIKIGDYRIGLEFQHPETVIFILVSHRKDIYKRFP